jgi:hypothetical protein
MRVVKLIILGALCSPSIVFCQSKNSISVQTGLMHCFFDGSPLMNTKYPSKAIKPFNGVLINSVGIRVERKFRTNNSISIDFMNFFEGYSKTVKELKKNQVSDRLFNTASINYNRIINKNDKLSFVFGGGLNYRFGQEIVVVNYGYFSNLGYESLNEVAKRSDFGLNIAGGIGFSPLKWMTFYSKIDFLSFVYINDKQAREKLKNVYGMSGFPSRFDLSLKLGLSINF